MQFFCTTNAAIFKTNSKKRVVSLLSEEKPLPKQANENILLHQNWKHDPVILSKFYLLHFINTKDSNFNQADVNAWESQTSL